jgi:hypothetical protein
MPKSHQYTDGMEPATEGNISAFPETIFTTPGVGGM